MVVVTYSYTKDNMKYYVMTDRNGKDYRVRSGDVIPMLTNAAREAKAAGNMQAYNEYMHCLKNWEKVLDDWFNGCADKIADMLYGGDHE